MDRPCCRRACYRCEAPPRPGSQFGPVAQWRGAACSTRASVSTKGRFGRMPQPPCRTCIGPASARCTGWACRRRAPPIAADQSVAQRSSKLLFRSHAACCRFHSHRGPSYKGQDPLSHLQAGRKPAIRRNREWGKAGSGRYRVRSCMFKLAIGASRVQHGKRDQGKGRLSSVLCLG